MVEAMGTYNIYRAKRIYEDRVSISSVRDVKFSKLYPPIISFLVPEKAPREAIKQATSLAFRSSLWAIIFLLLLGIGLVLVVILDPRPSS